MTHIKQITAISLFLLLGQLVSGQSLLNVDLYEFGCLDKVKMPETFSELYVYTGDDPNVEVKIVENLISEASTRWEKKKADRNCLSPDPNDCMVWCLMEVPEVKETYKLLEDTTSTKEWEMKSVLKYENGEMVKLPVICDKEAPIELLEEIKLKLIAKGFEIQADKKYKRLKGKLRKALNSFQLEYGLAVGKLTRETIDELAKL